MPCARCAELLKAIQDQTGDYRAQLEQKSDRILAQHDEIVRLRKALRECQHQKARALVLLAEWRKRKEKSDAE